VGVPLKNDFLQATIADTARAIPTTQVIFFVFAFIVIIFGAVERG
jgi:hypothetical protein